MILHLNGKEVEHTSIKTLYRYDLVDYASDSMFYLSHFPVLRYTPAGFWISCYSKGSQEKWVSATHYKCFAYPTEAQAYKSCVLRTKKRIEILRAQLAFCTEALTQAGETVPPDYSHEITFNNLLDS